jgi:hypothetical protein
MMGVKWLRLMSAHHREFSKLQIRMNRAKPFQPLVERGASRFLRRTRHRFERSCGVASSVSQGGDR